MNDNHASDRTEVVDLLHAVDAPRMTLNTQRVLHGGKARVQRRRTTIGGGLLAAAVAAGAIGILGRGVQGTPLPAAPTSGQPPLLQFEDQRTTPPTRFSADQQGGPSDTIYRVVRLAGRLGIDRTIGKVTVHLPVTARIGATSVRANDRGTLLEAIEVPADSTAVDVYGDTGTWNALRIADGSHVVLAQTTSSLQGVAVTRRDGTVVTDSGVAAATAEVGTGWQALVVPAWGYARVGHHAGGSGSIAHDRRCGQISVMNADSAGGEGRAACFARGAATGVNFAGSPVPVTSTALGSTGWYVLWVPIAGLRPTAVSNSVPAIVNSRSPVTRMTWTDADGRHSESAG